MRRGWVIDMADDKKDAHAKANEAQKEIARKWIEENKNKKEEKPKEEKK